MDPNHNHQPNQLRQQQEHEQSEPKSNNGGRENETMDPTMKVLIRQGIVGGDDSGGLETHGASDVLAFSRSVNKTDSSLE